MSPCERRPRVAFSARTTAYGAAGGMHVVATMDDAAGSPNRGTAVTGAGYTYRSATSRGCLPAKPLSITKVPDLTADYTGQKSFKIGDQVVWSGETIDGAPPYHDAELIDTMPDGIDYTPGSATFHVTGPAPLAASRSRPARSPRRSPTSPTDAPWCASPRRRSPSSRRSPTS